jgi:hypothetical protein
LLSLRIQSAIAMISHNFELSESQDTASVEEVIAFSMMPRNLRIDFCARR